MISPEFTQEGCITMKKFISLALVLLLAVATAVPVFAAGGINENEQRVLDVLSQTVRIGDTDFIIPVDYVNQAENYFNTIDMTAAQADEIIGHVNDGKQYFLNTGATDFKGLTYEDKLQIISYGQAAVAVLGMTLTADFADNTVTIVDGDGNVAFSAPAKIVPLTPSKPTDPSNPSGGSSSGSKPGPGTIKPTGMPADATMAIVISVAIVLFVAGAGIYLVKTKKARS